MGHHLFTFWPTKPRLGCQTPWATWPLALNTALCWCRCLHIWYIHLSCNTGSTILYCLSMAILVVIVVQSISSPLPPCSRLTKRGRQMAWWPMTPLIDTHQITSSFDNISLAYLSACWPPLLTRLLAIASWPYMSLKLSLHGELPYWWAFSLSYSRHWHAYRHKGEEHKTEQQITLLAMSSGACPQ